MTMVTAPTTEPSTVERQGPCDQQPSRRLRTAARRRVVAWLIVVALLAGWWTFLRPSSMGGPLTIITVTGESMEPGLHTGDVAVMYHRDSYDVGDVVAFRSTTPDASGKGPYVIHRIAGGNGEDGFLMRGDNNDWDDPWTPTADEVAGEMQYSLSNVGAAMRWISQPFHLAALMASVMIGLILAGGKPKEQIDTADEPEATTARETVDAS